MNRITTSKVLLLIAFLAFEAQAGEWRVDPAVRIAGEVDDNADLSIITDQEREISGFVGELSARFTYGSDVTDFWVEPLYRPRRYGEEDFDTDDEFLRLRFDRRGQNWRFGVRGRYGKELARTAERADVADLEVDDPNAAPDDDSGRVFVRGDRQRFEVVPNLSFNLSERTSLGFDLRYTDVTYDAELSNLLNDYTDARAAMTLKRKWSARNTALFSLTARNFDSECATCDSDTSGYGITGGFENRLSETTTLRAVVGLENTELSNGEDNISPVGNISLTRRLETITLFAQYLRSVSGGGGGSLLARDTINLTFNRELNDRFTAGLGVRAYSTTALEEGTVNIDERDYVQLRALVIWNLSESFSLEGNYRYTILSRRVLGESANSNNIMLWLNWRPTPFGGSQ